MIFGVGSFARLPQELADLGLERLLLVATRSAREHADALAAELGPRVVARVHEVRQHVPEALAAQARELAASAGADGVVSVGGGSATGLGKAVAVGAGLLLVAVPTTFAGSEATPVYGISGTRKVTGRDLRALPRLVVYDAGLSGGLPPRVTATSGLNAIAHCVEGLWAAGANPVSTLLAREGLQVMARCLPRATWYPQEVGDREDALYAAYLAGSVFAVTGGGLHHSLCHVLGGTWGLDHGATHAVLLPHVTAYNAPAVPDCAALVARSLGARDAAAGLWALGRTVAAPAGLAELGMPLDGLDEAARLGVEAAGAGNPRPLDVPALRRLLDNAFHGRPPGGSGTSARTGDERL